MLIGCLILILCYISTSGNFDLTTIILQPLQCWHYMALFMIIMIYGHTIY